MKLSPSTKPLIETYFPEYMTEDDIKAEAFNSSDVKEGDENGRDHRNLWHKELQSKSLCELTLEDVLEIQRMNKMPLSLLEEYNIYMFSECSMMMKQKIDALFLLEVDSCCSEFQDFDVL